MHLCHSLESITGYQLLPVAERAKPRLKRGGGRENNGRSKELEEKYCLLMQWQSVLTSKGFSSAVI